jgi:hypothetical protein
MEHLAGITIRRAVIGVQPPTLQVLPTGSWAPAQLGHG